jgi:D-alanyl-D-alanine carboxypeptidase
MLADPYKVWQPNELLAIAYKYPPYFAPGKGFHYSNTNYILLGLIMEQLTHLSAVQAFQRYIFGPLGLHESSLPPLSSSAIPDPHAQGYMYGIDSTGKGPTLNVTDWNPSVAWMAGSMISTLHDLKIWGQSPGDRSVTQRGNPEGATELGDVCPRLAREAKVLWTGGV